MQKRDFVHKWCDKVKNIKCILCKFLSKGFLFDYYKQQMRNILIYRFKTCPCISSQLWKIFPHIQNGAVAKIHRSETKLSKTMTRVFHSRAPSSRDDVPSCPPSPNHTCLDLKQNVPPCVQDPAYGVIWVSGTRVWSRFVRVPPGWSWETGGAEVGLYCGHPALVMVLGPNPARAHQLRLPPQTLPPPPHRHHHPLLLPRCCLQLLY